MKKKERKRKGERGASATKSKETVEYCSGKGVLSEVIGNSVKTNKLCDDVEKRDIMPKVEGV